MKKTLITPMLLGMVFVMAACSATPVRRSVKETWNDTRTATKIRYKLMRDDEVRKSHMHVEVFRGTVTLTGRAMTDAEKARAEAVAKSVKRVTGVENYVHVVGNDDTKAAPAVAKIQETDKIKIVTPAGKEVIEEKTLQEVPLASVASATPQTASVATIRVATGQPAPKVVFAPRAVEPKLAKKSVAKAATPARNDRPLAKVTPIPTAATPPVTDTEAPLAAKAAAVPMSTAPSSTVVGRSKTGLPWDGEVYEDDASRVTPVASRSPIKTPTVPAPAPVASAPVPTGDDIAKEASAELEKLRQKK